MKKVWKEVWARIMGKLLGASLVGSSVARDYAHSLGRCNYERLLEVYASTEQVHDGGMISAFVDYPLHSASYAQ